MQQGGFFIFIFTTLGVGGKLRGKHRMAKKPP